jgi:DNA mismatch repair protein MutS2
MFKRQKWDEIKAGDEVKVLTYGQKGESIRVD